MTLGSQFTLPFWLMRRFRSVMFVTTSFLSLAAYAVDGVVEINQAKILATGGFPYVISASGSYRLTSNISVSALPSPANRTAIRLDIGNVVLDLNGFTISGPVQCNGPSPATLVCTPTATFVGLGYGITDGGAQRNIVIKNGIVTGMGRDGIGLTASDQVQVDNVQATENGGTGIGISAGIIRNSLMYRNGGDGATINYGTIIASVARGNRGVGLSLLRGLATDNVADSNGGLGLSIDEVGFSRNVLTGNNGGNSGVQVGGGISAGQNVCSHAGGLSTVCP